MSPMMALRDGKVRYALGLPGGRKIFPSALQALINLIDHGMALQEAVEAPRIWTEGPCSKSSTASPTRAQGLEARGHTLKIMPTVAGGMNAIQFHDDGTHDRRRLLARRRHGGGAGRWVGACGGEVRVAGLRAVRSISAIQLGYSKRAQTVDVGCECPTEHSSPCSGCLPQREMI
jgi:hypothetical protein